MSTTRRKFVQLLGAAMTALAAPSALFARLFSSKPTAPWWWGEPRTTEPLERAWNHSRAKRGLPPLGVADDGRASKDQFTGVKGWNQTEVWPAGVSGPYRVTSGWRMRNGSWTDLVNATPVLTKESEA